MSELFFPDNTVFVNFGIIDRIDLLDKALNGKGAWCVSIQTECERSSRIDGVHSLSTVGSFLGEPYIPTPVERIQTHVIRDQLSAPGDRSTDHLGEAETLAVMTSRFPGGYFVTDDGGATKMASRYQIQVVNTWQLLRLITNRGHASCIEMHGHLNKLHEESRGGPHFQRVGEVRSWAGLDPYAP